MATEVKVLANTMSKDQLQGLLQTIRDWERKNALDDEVVVLVDCPHLTVKDLADILDSIKPPFQFRKS